MLSDLVDRLVRFFTTDRAVDAVRASIVLLITAIVARIGGRGARHLVSLRGDVQRAVLVGRLTAWGLFGLGFAAALDELGFKLHIVLGAAGLATVAIGLAAQTTLASLLSGFILHGERPFSVGDTIEIDGITGEVLFIDLMSTRIRTLDNRLVRFPNELLVKTKLVNTTRLPLRRLDLTIPIGNQERFPEIRALLLDLADKNSLCLAEPPPAVIIVSFGETSSQIQFSLWTRTENLTQLQSTIGESIHHAFGSIRRATPPPVN